MQDDMKEVRQENASEKREGASPVLSGAEKILVRKNISEKWAQIRLVDRGRLKSLRKRVEEDLEKYSSSSSLKKFSFLLDAFAA
ncbi:MAG: hypothetical protein IKC08_03150, partial [Lentisphaeria bacterium]|nr:hypothetical protein [Lentisphaeria bacterium]